MLNTEQAIKNQVKVNVQLETAEKTELNSK